MSQIECQLQQCVLTSVCEGMILVGGFAREMAIASADVYKNYLLELQHEHGLVEGTLKAAPTFVLPLIPAALTYMVTKRFSLAAAVGLTAAFMEAFPLDDRHQD